MSPPAKTALALIMIVATAVAVIIAGYFIYKSRRDEIIVDENLCPLNSPIKGHTVVAIDRTDPFTPQQRDALKDLISRIKRDIAVHARLSLTLITGDPEEAGVPIFNACKPLDPDNINILIENERRLRDKWNEKFGKPLDAVLATLLEGGIAPTSPVLEAIDVILWSHNFQENLPKRELVVFSDLLQNTADQNHYRRVPSPCEIASSPLGQRLKAKNWDNLRVVLHYWRNSQAPNAQGRQHLSFWTRLFYILGAREVFEGSRLVSHDEASLRCDLAIPPSPPPPGKPKKQSNPPRPGPWDIEPLPKG